VGIGNLPDYPVVVAKNYGRKMISSCGRWKIPIAIGTPTTACCFIGTSVMEERCKKLHLFMVHFSADIIIAP